MVIAEFLEIPRVSVMALGEVVQPEDFIVEQSLGDQLNGVYMQMALDPAWSTLVPKAEVWDAADESTKLLVATMYQAVLQASMLEKATSAKRHPSHFSPREGLSPAIDQVRKWGSAPRQSACDSSNLP